MLTPFEPEHLPYLVYPDRFSTSLPYEAYHRLCCAGIPEASGPYLHPVVEVKLFRGESDPGTVVLISRYFDPRPEMSSPEQYVPLQAYLRAACNVVSPDEDPSSIGQIYWNPSEPTRATVALLMFLDISWDEELYHVGYLALDIALDIEDEYRRVFREHVVGDHAAIRLLLRELREPPQNFGTELAQRRQIALGPRLGHGGTAVVYAADLEGRPIVVKVLLPDARFDDVDRLEQRFEKEVQLVKRMSDSGATPGFVCSGAIGKTRFLAMERIPGEPLYKFIRSEVSNMSLSAKSDLCRSIARALHAIQLHKLVHRDLSPKNIMIRPDGSAHIIDLGTATLLSERDPNMVASSATVPVLTLPNDQMGSLKYAAPESRDDPSKATLQSDIFSLGIIGYELLLGRNIAGNLPSLHDLMGVDEDLSTFLRAAVAWSPEERPSLEDLRRIAGVQ
jgi:tRNA A-37 threonylcarbamoyl transferase component Bud32